ncbi:secreted RxLR effector protein 161-like [Hevea brasiliensis]|uniref:secreted RxLR effector protein 161-like n=1 Tax=Hevea brasiliensis TaxID=3981 RepID=UPI0025E57323|nr:secreted RxLR effector protein 161-like [Hevea brasiliensis]
MKELGKLKFFLGIEVARNSNGIFLCQRKYELDVISEVGLLGCKPAKTPLEQNHKLALTKSDDVDDPAQYRRLVGRLIYLTITQPELSYCVHILAQFMQQPKKAHWEAAIKVVHYLKGNPDEEMEHMSNIPYSSAVGSIMYLKGTIDVSLTFDRAKMSDSVVGYVDSDFAGDLDKRRSLIGYLFTLSGSAMSWKATLQATVALSTIKTEYMALAEAVKEVL